MGSVLDVDDVGKVDEAEKRSLQRSRLYWQCRRGMLELDILLQAFYTSHGESLSDDDVVVFTDLLACTDDQLYGYFIGQVVPSDSKLSAMVHKIRHPSPILSTT